MDQQLVCFVIQTWSKMLKEQTMYLYIEEWYNPNAITNIFSCVEIKNKYRITYDSTVEKEFDVHLPDK